MSMRVSKENITDILKSLDFFATEIEARILTDDGVEIRYAEHGGKLDLVQKEPESQQAATRTKEISQAEQFQTVLELAGLIEYNISFTAFDNRALGSYFPRTIETGQSSIQNWFEILINEVLHSTDLILDTNMILMNAPRNIFAIRIKKDLRDKIRLRIPRLVILELETIANSEKVKSSFEGKATKRLALRALGSIQEMLDQQGSVLAPLNATLLESFDRHRGERVNDSWIRKEIHDYIYGGSFVNTTQSSRKLESQLFATRDLASALAGTAEGIHTLYFSRSAERPNVNLDGFINFLQFAAIYWEQIKLELIRPSGYEYLITGVWEGKTTEEWQVNDLRLTYLKSK